MGKQYYCDYCDKSFADNLTSRKNHLKGVNHQRLKRLHYASFRDPATILVEESAKQPCMRYIETGECSFGDGCKFSHLTIERRQQLEQQISEAKKKKHGETGEPRLEDWLAKRAKRLKLKEGKQAEPEPPEPPEPAKLPEILAHIPNLPPSLLPPPPDASQQGATGWA